MFFQKNLFAKALMIEVPWFVDKALSDQPACKLKDWFDFECG